MYDAADTGTRNPALYYPSRLFSLFCRAELAEAKKRAKTYKERKKHDRFDGMPEEEVSKRVLPDHLTNNLDIIIVSGCQPLNADYQRAARR